MRTACRLVTQPPVDPPQETERALWRAALVCRLHELRQKRRGIDGDIEEAEALLAREGAVL